MAEALLPSPFKVLVDNPEDGCAEEVCWVPVEYAPTEGEAIELAVSEQALPWGDGLKFEVAGKEWYRRDPGFKRDPETPGLWRNERTGVDADYEPWLPCSKFAKTGIEVWRLEVTDDDSRALPRIRAKIEGEDR